jgi:hypothetical protein
MKPRQCTLKVVQAIVMKETNKQNKTNKLPCLIVDIACKNESSKFVFLLNS